VGGTAPQEDAFVSGAQDGALCLWLAGCKEPQAKIDYAHEQGNVLSLAYHPVGHSLASSEWHTLPPRGRAPLP
jgi:hypothetical protein